MLQNFRPNWHLNLKLQLDQLSLSSWFCYSSVVSRWRNPSFSASDPSIFNFSAYEPVASSDCHDMPSTFSTNVPDMIHFSSLNFWSILNLRSPLFCPYSASWNSFFDSVMLLSMKELVDKSSPLRQCYNLASPATHISPRN